MAEKRMVNFSKIIQRIQQVSKDSKTQVRKPRIGRMYAYGYIAKTRDQLPYWDAFPLVIPVEYTENGFYGLNLHYLDTQNRVKLLNILLPMNERNQNTQKVAISYQALKSLATTIWKPCFKRYLWSHVRTNFLHIPVMDWNDVVRIPVISFRKGTASKAHADSKRFA